MPPFDPDKVPAEHADLFYHGKPGPDGEPVGLTDEQWDEQAAFVEAHPDIYWPFGHENEKEEA